MKTAIVVGSGAGGATVAKELQGPFQVTVLEEGPPFRRAAADWQTIERLRRSRLLVDERLLRIAMPAMRIRKSSDLVLVNGVGVGGGCPYGVKWDIRAFLDQAIDHGAELVTGVRVDRIVVEGGRATGVLAGRRLDTRFHAADLVVISAGGFGTPAILGRSGITCEPRLFADPVLTVAARVPAAWQCNEIAMPFVVRRPHYLLSPYFDWVSALFNPAWRHPLQDTVGIMIKLADEEIGSVSPRGRVDKRLTALDRVRLVEGVGIATEILTRFGADPANVFTGTINAGHPGGTLPLSPATASTLHDDRLPDNVYVADASLLPRSLGGPPIMTIIALAKRIASLCRADAGRR